MTLTDKLTLIVKPILRLGVELGEKLRCKKWTYVVDGCEAELHNEFGLFAAMGNCETAHEDAAFIAHARNMHPAVCQALLVAIATFEKQSADLKDMYPDDLSIAEDALRTIADSFPDDIQDSSPCVTARG